MHPEDKLDTITAIATPPGIGGVGIIRISGPESLRVASRIFCSGRPPVVPCQNSSSAGKEMPPPDLQAWRLHYGYIFDHRNGHVLDEVLLAVMPAPHSYTKEDVVEIQAHAGAVVMRRILDLILGFHDIRLAEPGEFTKRAFLNGRIDLTEAEAVMDMIVANSEAAVEIAMAHISGRFGEAVTNLIQTLHRLRVLMEAEIDFSDGMEEEFEYERIALDLKESVLYPVTRLITQHHEANFFRDGLSVVIAGGPNVGKSSLMNQLLHKDRAIVSDVPGTTRDFIEASMVSNGIPIILTDTAGFRTTNAGPVERLGIENANQAISSADIILFVVDISKPFDSDAIFLFEMLDKMKKKRIVIMNKWDVPGADRNFKSHPLRMTPFLVKTSCLENTGIDDLQNMIADIIFSVTSITQDRIVPNVRQRRTLETAASHLTDAVNALEKDKAVEIAAIDVQSAENALREVVGDTLRPDILDSVFDRFCVGK